MPLYNDKTMNSGIYQIRNLINNKRYVGSSQNLEKRWSTHVESLRKNTHHNAHLQNSWNKYGEDTFRFEIIEYCMPVDLLIFEQVWIDKFDFDQLYNIQRIAGKGMMNMTHTAETISKLSALNTGKIMQPEIKEKISVTKKASKLLPWNKGMRTGKSARTLRRHRLEAKNLALTSKKA